MVRKNYFEILDGMNFNPSTEFDNLCILLTNGLLEELNHKFLNYQNFSSLINANPAKTCLIDLSIKRRVTEPINILDKKLNCSEKHCKKDG